VWIGPIWIEGERLRHQFVGPLELAFRVAGNTSLRPREEFCPNPISAWALLGSMASAFRKAVILQRDSPQAMFSSAM
jgi:hypothetical protein